MHKILFFLRKPEEKNAKVSPVKFRYGWVTLNTGIFFLLASSGFRIHVSEMFCRTVETLWIEVCKVTFKTLGLFGITKCPKARKISTFSISKCPSA